MKYHLSWVTLLYVKFGTNSTIFYFWKLLNFPKVLQGCNLVIRFFCLFSSSVFLWGSPGLGGLVSICYSRGARMWMGQHIPLMCFSGSSKLHIWDRVATAEVIFFIVQVIVEHNFFLCLCYPIYAWDFGGIHVMFCMK